MLYFEADSNQQEVLDNHGVNKRPIKKAQSAGHPLRPAGKLAIGKTIHGLVVKGDKAQFGGDASGTAEWVEYIDEVDNKPYFILKELLVEVQDPASHPQE